MLRPVGSLSPAVYWRRRLLAVGALLLIALTGYVLFGTGGDKKKPTGHQTGPTPTAASAHPSTSTTPAVPCVPSVLGVSAATAAPRYAVGQQPELEIKVTNTGEAPCVANLSDGQIELLVFNGESRVWGSHDCKIEPGDSPAVLTPRQSVRRSIRWTGLSSEPNCAGDRQRVGKGVYTLHARFGPMQGHTATFTIG
jgi:hypothetical protein